MCESTPSTAPERNGRGPLAGDEPLRVAVGVIRDAEQRVLIARRPSGVHLAGYWEFPGGKLEPGETVSDALVRELREELGIAVLAATPLIRVRHEYPARRVLLDVWQVDRFAGEARGLQGQPVRWVDTAGLSAVEFPEANRAIAAAARLPDCYPIVDDDSGLPAALERNIETLAARGFRLIQLRASRLRPLERHEQWVHSLVAKWRLRGVALLPNSDAAFAERVDAAGVHLTAERLMACSQRPLDDGRWVGASCHDAEQLAHAERLGIDFALLGPVAVTRTHPGLAPLGWHRFTELVDPVNLPVYALGGLGRADLARAREAGGRGVAGIRAFLEGNDES